MEYVKIIADAGHGWFTSGKSSKFHKILSGLFQGNDLLKENGFNEAICNKMSVLNKETVFITPEWWDVPLSERVKREHNAHTKNTIFLSVHADAFTVKNAATGGTFFYNSEKGRLIAEYMTGFLRRGGYPIKLRAPKKANFKLLRETKSVAILFEAGFMTTKKDLDFLRKDNFRNKTAVLLNNGLSNIPIGLL